MQLTESTRLRLYLEGNKSVVLRDITDIPSQCFAVCIHGQVCICDTVRNQFKCIRIDGIHHLRFCTSRYGFNLAGPLGQDVLEFVGIILTGYIHIILCVRCQAFQICAFRVLKGNTDGVHRGSGILQGLSLYRAVPIDILDGLAL